MQANEASMALRLSAKRARLDAERWLAAGSISSGPLRLSQMAFHTNEADALEAGAEALELLAFIAENVDCVAQLSNDDKKWSYWTGEKHVDVDAGGVTLGFIDALRLAKGTK